VLVLDSNGIKYYSFNVFLPPDKFIPQLEFGLGKLALKMQDLKKAESQLKLVVVKYPKSNIAPEAQYWYDVTKFKISNNVSVEVNAWRKIKENYTDSICAKNVSGVFSCKKEYLFYASFQLITLNGFSVSLYSFSAYNNLSGSLDVIIKL